MSELENGRPQVAQDTESAGQTVAAMREAARQLLVDGQVDVVIGYAAGSLPLRTTPCFVDDPERVEQLVWNASCENNLATYLQHIDGKVGIVAKGCDARAVVTKIVERQIDREKVVIIGVPCQGVIDRQRIESLLNGREVSEAQITNDHLVLRGISADDAAIGHPFEETLDLQEVLCEDCVVCRHKDPSVYDILVEDADAKVAEDGASAGQAQRQHPTVEEFESWTADERWAYFSEEFSRCIRCYACREACPACYCTQCFVDQSQPTWFGKSDDPSDVMAFHLVRIYHVAGRCLDCGACVRACPMDIDLRTLGRKLEKDVRELFGYEPGMDLESAPLLGTFRADDPQGFIR
jgi:formate dehydrogenase subunit beta